MTRKKPFSGKAKKQQIKDKREQRRGQAAFDWDDDGKHRMQATSDEANAVTPLPSTGRGDLRTVFQAESRDDIEARKRDATRALVYAPDRGHSLGIYAYGIQDARNQPAMLVKPQWSHDMTPDELIEAEDRAYHAWLQALDTAQREDHLTRGRCNLFERNIEVWRQLWRTIERSDVVVHLADARCPVLHLSEQLITHVRDALPAKRIVIVLTKADLVSPERVASWEAYVGHRYAGNIPVISYNSEQIEASNTLLLRTIAQVAGTIDMEIREVVRQVDTTTLTIGFVGEPNVGKSSLLNNLFGRKLVSVSPTPGHTKHLQTHYLVQHDDLLTCGGAFNKVQVCDCPGVVFPRLNVPVLLQILFGSFPIAQTREAFSAVRFIAENCDPPMHVVYKLTPVEDDDIGDGWSPYTLCESYAKQRGFHLKRGRFDLHRAANQILRDTLNGKKVVLSFPPPPPASPLASSMTTSVNMGGVMTEKTDMETKADVVAENTNSLAPALEGVIISE